MCEPATLAVISLAATAAGAGVSAYGSISAGNYQAAVARNNARYSEYQARDAEDRGQIAEGEQRRKTRQMLGTQRATMAANGADLSSGSALDVQSDTAKFGELDALTIRSNARREAYGYRVGGVNQEAEARLAKMKGGFGAASSILGAASQISGDAAGFKKSGVFG
jgi:hypothetical protein